MDYCTPSDLWDYGLPRGAIPNPARAVESVSVITGALELNAHGLEDGDAFRLRPDLGGCMPLPLAAGATYYALVIDDSHFRARATAEGSAIALGTAGQSIVLVMPLQVQKWIAYASRVIDELVPAHAIPLGAALEDIPPIVRMTCAELAAWKGGLVKGAKSVTLGEAYDAARRRLDAWEKGRPIRGATFAPAGFHKSGRHGPAPRSVRLGAVRDLMSLDGDLGTLRKLREHLETLPQMLAAAVAQDVAPLLTAEARSAYDSGVDVYGNPRPTSVAKGSEGRALDLVVTGATRDGLRFFADGGRVRVPLPTSWTRYLIGKYKILPIGDRSDIPEGWKALIESRSAALRFRELAQAAGLRAA